MKKFLPLLVSSLSLITSSWATTHLVLIRHGETDWNKEHRLQGHSDIPLNEKGLRQVHDFAEEVIKAYPNIHAIYSSDLNRAYSTAQPTAKKFNLNIHTRTGLREINWGELEGVFVNDPSFQAIREEEKNLMTIYPNRKERWNFALIPGSESYNQLVDRLKNELLKIALDHPNQTVLVFCHGMAIRTLIHDVLDEEEQFGIEHCALAHFSIDLKKNGSALSFHKLENLIEPD